MYYVIASGKKNTKLSKDTINNLETKLKERKVDYHLFVSLYPGHAEELTKACKQYAVPLQDGQAVITPAFNIFNANYIIHAVGPNFNTKPNALKELYMAYYNCLKVLKENSLTSISFPLISAGIFGGNLENPVATSTESCLNAYDTFTKEKKHTTVTISSIIYPINAASFLLMFIAILL